MWGLTINGKHTGADWGLGCTSCTLTAPEPRTYSIDIPGADGVLDTTAARGRVTYRNRTLTAVFERVYASRAAFDAACAALNTAYHGRTVTVTLDSDAAHTLSGRAKWQHDADGFAGTHTLTVDCAPYRMAAAETAQTFEVSGELAITLQNAQKAVIPVFDTEAEGMAVKLPTGAQYTILQTGGYTIPEVCLQEGANPMTLIGTGSVAIRYREGVL